MMLVENASAHLGKKVQLLDSLEIKAVIHQSIRFRPQCTCEQEHYVGLNSVVLLVVQWVVIGQYSMGQSLMD